MSRNMGMTDRVLRVAAALILLFVAFGTGIAAAGVLHWLALAVAAIFLITALAARCPLYGVLGLKTCRAG